jgi:signal transduction histidine kinase
VGRFSLLIDSELLPAAYGHPATVLLTLQDVSQLKHTQDQLQKAVQLRDDFLTVASHELRTPLTPLQLKLQSLIRDCSAELPPEQLREKVQKTTRSATDQVRKLVELIGDLLDVSRLDEGRLSLSLEPVDLAALVRQVAERFEPLARHANAPLVLQVEGPLVGFWDRSRLEQVIDNLLSNALKYGPGRPVTLRVEQHEDEARLIVSDEGIGIASESLPRIFEKFERAVSPRHYGGLGLGLYITRQIVQALGGSIRVESQPEQGATFTVELPLAGAGLPRDLDAGAPSPGWSH